MPIRHAGPVGLALTLALGIGCATTPAASSSTEASASTSAPASDSTMNVSVVHNRADGGTTTIYIEPAAGVRTTLGTIDAGSTRTFTYRIQGQNRQVKLIALNALGQTLQSEQITVPRGAGLTWDLQINSVRVRRAPTP